MLTPSLLRYRFALLLCVPFLAGCLEFATQTIAMRHDAGRDRVIFFLVYHGLGHSKNDAKEAQGALRRAVEGDEFCFFEWPLHIRPKELREKEQKEPLAKELVDRLEVRRVGFFVNGAGQLAGGQIVVLNRVSGFLKACNDLLNQWLIATDGRPETAEWDRHTQRMLLAAAKRGHAWVRMRGNAVAFHGFCSDHDFELMKREGMMELFKTEEKDRPQAIEMIARLPLSLLREGDGFVVVFGNPAGRTRVEIPPHGRKPYRDNLFDFAKETWGFTLDGAVAPFLLEPNDSLEGQFAQAMRLTERVRILLAQEGEKADQRLREALDELPKQPANTEDVRAFWKAWLEKPAPQPPSKEAPGAAAPPPEEAGK